MRDLEMPLHFSGRGIERNHGTAEEIRARPVSAVVVVRSRGIVRGEDNAALRIERHRESPLRGTRSVFIALVAPGVGARVARLLWDGPELPDLRSRARVECARAPGVPVGAGDEQILINDGRGFVRD